MLANSNTTLVLNIFLSKYQHEILKFHPKPLAHNKKKLEFSGKMGKIISYF